MYNDSCTGTSSSAMMELRLWYKQLNTPTLPDSSKSASRNHTTTYVIIRNIQMGKCLQLHKSGRFTHIWAKTVDKYFILVQIPKIIRGVEKQQKTLRLLKIDSNISINTSCISVYARLLAEEGPARGRLRRHSLWERTACITVHREPLVPALAHTVISLKSGSQVEIKEFNDKVLNNNSYLFVCRSD